MAQVIIGESLQTWCPYKTVMLFLFDAANRLSVHEADAVHWLRDYRQRGGPAFDFVFVDAFDGENNIPVVFTEQGQQPLSMTAY